ncbi:MULTISPECIES: hypothetical protein [unclassified Actinoplanes]|uniref:hypothetical protein n=1 Tax=unclassified Actinoplanes TaxID=2626549 RepID=UPI0002E901D2|nr:MULTISPECIES: hypothetical protein [unclassified Actinoplanes]SLL97076.1 hypothetical protein ACSP50_0272 [Actinoplanes sp. SE50/110]
MRLLTAAVVIGLGVRVVRSRHRRFLHPAGRSFAGTLEIWGGAEPLGATLLDTPAVHDVTVRVSKGAGTRGARVDIRGVAVRVGPADLLLSSTGRTALTKRLPVPRLSFDTVYGAITPYRTGTRKLYLEAVPDPDARPLGRALSSIPAGAALLLRADDRTVGRVALRHALPEATDAALAFDPIRNATPDLHPTGLIHGSRALAYRLSQRWRGATPPATDPAALARTVTHH